MDRSTPAPPPAHQRARGALDLSFKRRGEATVLDTLRQEGCLKARFPRDVPPAWPGAVTLNTAGGITGGDVLRTRIVVAPGTAATVAAQAAERIYRALPGRAASVRTALHVGAGACLEWLPQETILFDRCALDRELAVDLAPDATFTGVESLVFGRRAMGETVRTAHIQDAIRIRRDGKPVLHDAIRLRGPVQEVLDRPASMKGGRAAATVVHAAADAARHLDPVRAALAPHDAGASCWDGLLVARIVAPDGVLLRAAVVAVLAALRADRPLPRVWMC